MQSGGQAAGIQLQVGLDLAFFRQQLTTLGATAAGYRLPINIHFNRSIVQKELNALSANIKKRNYFLEVKTNLAAEIDNAKKLSAALDKLKGSREASRASTSQQLNVGTLGRTPTQGGLGSKDVEKLYRASARAGLLAFNNEVAKNKASMVAAMEEVGLEAVAGLLNGLTSQDARVQAAAEYLGENLIKTVKRVLGIASPSKEFEEIGKNVGEGFEKGALSSMDNAFDALENKVRQRGKILDTIARGIFRMLGMDPAAMLEKARQERLPASINWLATAPPRRAFMGPSSSGRALPPGPSQEMLPGSSFATQKLLSGDLLTPSMKAAIRDVANDLIDGIRERINAAIREVRVEDLGKVAQRMLTGSPVAGYLPPVARFGEGRTPSPYSTGRLGRDGETRAELFARREREARMRSALREMDAMGGGTGRTPSPYRSVNRAARPTSAMIPYAAGGALVPVGGGGGVVPPRPPSSRAGAGGLGGFGRALSNVNLPGAGVVREIGDEFAMATKQVLLFGTAYKALAFLTSFPSQVSQAVSALQSFNNTLKEISPSAEEARASNQFILDIVNRYNVPLQSARDGFVKLYASMAPAGFKGDEIRALFTGVSQAAATFGMSADKVDRVNYAFAQMASKGQVMSEELKGQLGDVLPGAMGIFAEAAGFEGRDAIEKFSKALEDGAYKGDAMRVLLKNVTGVLQKEFGPGAEGAARTFQGVINRMQNSTRLLYEAFEPVAVGFLNSVVVPLTNGIKTITDGFNAFFANTQAKTAGGNALASQLKELKPSFDGILENLKQLLPTFKLLGDVLLGAAKAFTVLAGNPVAGFLLKVYANVLLVNGAFTLLGGRALVGLIASINLSISRFIAMNAAVFALQRTSAVATSTLAGTQLQMALLARGAGSAIGPVSALRGALLGIARLGSIVVGISIAIYGLEALVKARQEIDAIRGIRAKGGTAASLIGASPETVKESKKVAGGTLSAARKELEQIKAIRAGLPAGVGSLYGTRQATLEQRIQDAQGVLNMPMPSAAKAKPVLPIEAMPAGAGGAGGKEKAGAKLDTYDRSRLDFIRQNAEQEKLALDRRLQQKLISQTQFDIAVAELELDTKKLELAEQLRISKLEINRDNLSTQDKQLKLTDAQIAYQNELNIAQDKYTVAVEGAKRELEGPFDDALQRTSAAMAEQRMLLENLKNGIGELTPDQQAYLQVQDLIVEKTEDEVKMLEAKITSLRQIFEQQALLNKEVEREKKMRELSQAIDMARALTPDAELRQKLVQEGYEGAALDARFSLEKTRELAEKTKQDLQGIASSIGDAFGEAFKGVVSGTSSAQEALAGMFQSIADSFADMMAQMIAEWLKAQVLKGFMSLFPGAGAGLGSSASNLNQYAPLLPMANGGVLSGGFQAFANGGIVTGPTLGLVGEGRYNEAVIPLPDGKSVPVDLGGAMGGNITSNIVVNVSSDGKMSSSGGGADAAGFGRKLEGAVKQVIAGELRPGGLLSRRN